MGMTIWDPKEGPARRDHPGITGLTLRKYQSGRMTRMPYKVIKGFHQQQPQNDKLQRISAHMTNIQVREMNT